VAALVNLDADRTAVEAARRDPRAFEALYRKYVAQVYNFALYELRDPHAAEDLTAQVFLRALGGLRHFHELSYQQMGEVIGVPVKTIKSRLFEARSKLRQRLLRQGPAS